ncbi:hypothetical protein E2320_013833 [Naja naja]|nr:hypothetical protein E2320_013833 [Naja naja]
MAMAASSGGAGDGLRTSSKWLDAYYDPVANLHTFSSCVTLADLHGDGNHKLVVGNFGSTGHEMKLKVYQGTTLLSENTLPDLPTSVVSFLMELHEPRMPALAVASGPYIYVYKNLRPYFKFTLPPMEPNPMEKVVWDQAKEDKVDLLSMKEMLEAIRENAEMPLSVQSLRFLTLELPEMESFVNQHKFQPIKRQTVITCMATLKKNRVEEDAISCLVVGTENMEILILDPEAFTILSKVAIPGVPAFLDIAGQFDGNTISPWHVGTVAFTSFAGMSTSGKGAVLQQTGLQTAQILHRTEFPGCGFGSSPEEHHGGLFRRDAAGLQPEVTLPAAPVTLGLMDEKLQSFQAVLVSLANREIHVYRDKNLVNVIQVPVAIPGVPAFLDIAGQFDVEYYLTVACRNGSVYILRRYVHQWQRGCSAADSGGLIIKILKRTSTFHKGDATAGVPVAQSTKLNVPKKTKLYVDQTLRERECGVDLSRIRLTAARAYVRALECSMAPVSESLQEPLKLNAVVQGMGPTFKLCLNLQNMSENPGSSLFPLQVFVLKEGSSQPLLTAHISMPVSEGLTAT